MISFLPKIFASYLKCLYVIFDGKEYTQTGGVCIRSRVEAFSSDIFLCSFKKPSQVGGSEGILRVALRGLFPHRSHKERQGRHEKTEMSKNFIKHWVKASRF